MNVHRMFGWCVDRQLIAYTIAHDFHGDSFMPTLKGFSYVAPSVCDEAMRGGSCTGEGLEWRRKRYRYVVSMLICS